MHTFHRTLALATFGLSLFGLAAQAAECGFCHKPIEGMPYVLKAGGKTEPFKCVFCAIADAEEYKGNVSIVAPSENPKKPVVLKRTGNKWSALPAGAAFVAAPRPKHKVCGEQYRAFTSASAAKAYIAKNPEIVESKPLTLAQIVAISTD